jgi:hypothetical protein
MNGTNDYRRFPNISHAYSLFYGGTLYGICPRNLVESQKLGTGKGLKKLNKKSFLGESMYMPKPSVD